MPGSTPFRISLTSLRSRLVAVAVLIALAFAISSCGSSDNGGGQEDSGGEQGQSSSSGGGTAQSSSPETTGGMMETTGMETTGMETTGGMTETTGESTSMGTTSMGEMTSMGETTGGSTLSSQPQDEIRDGTWRVGGAGTVDFQFTDGGVELGDVNPNSGWDQRVASQSSDELEVHFTKGDTDWKFEVEVDGGQAEISTERDIQPADSGSYRVGDAAKVEFNSGDGSLSLDSVDTSDGWKETTRDESSDDIEIDFKKGNDLTAEFEAEQSDGQIDLETNQKVSGPVPN